MLNAKGERGRERKREEQERKFQALFISSNASNNANPSMVVDDRSESFEERRNNLKKRIRNPLSVLYGQNRYFCVIKQTKILRVEEGEREKGNLL